MLTSGVITGTLGRKGIITDGPQSSPSAVLLGISYKTALQGGEKKLQERVKQALGFDALKLNRNVFWYATQVKVIGEVFVDSEKKTKD